jgi:tetratricopeptide (TPR) repeat protein
VICSGEPAPTYFPSMSNATTFPQPAVSAALSSARLLMQQDDYREALNCLADIERLHSLSGLLWQERARCHRALGEGAAAIGAYKRAVELNDALSESWQALVELYRSAGRLDEARGAAECLERLSTLPPQLAAGSSLLNEGELEPAEALARDYLNTHGPHVQGMRLLAQVGIKRNVLDDAELLLEHVLARAPHYYEARYEYAAVLLHRRKYLHALEQTQLLLNVTPGNFPYRLLHARNLDGLGRYEEALSLYRQLLGEAPGNVEIQLCIAHALQTVGNRQDAIDAFRFAADSNEGFTAACFALANMKAYRFSDEEIARMRAREMAPDTTLSERYHLCFALGKAYEDRKAFAESFAWYERGNALKRSDVGYRPELAERGLRLQATVCTQAFFAARRGFGCNRPDPIFVVGLTRSGSTLIEQILASHSLVNGTLELPALPHLVQQFRNRDSADAPPRYPAILTELEPADFRRMGEIYLDETRPYRGTAPFFVDKMLANFRDIGLIHLILPNARIIDARREPMACCFGNFKQLFLHGQEYSYSLEEMGRYYRWYVELMDHWDRVLPGQVLRVRYEDVVNDLEGSVRRMLEFCGLPFEPACLEFYKTDRSVRTVSSEQVRQPIYRAGLEQWRNYEPWLGPLKTTLGLG